MKERTNDYDLLLSETTSYIYLLNNIQETCGEGHQSSRYALHALSKTKCERGNSSSFIINTIF